MRSNWRGGRASGARAGFVNAVLRDDLAAARRRCRCRRGPPIRPIATAALDYLSITLSHPRWLVARWYDRLGFDAAEAWLQFNNAPAPLTLRANRLRVTPRGARRPARRGRDRRAARRAFAPDGFIVEEGQPLRGAGLDAGWFVVQDEASQLVTLLAGDASGPRVLDTCASPGGKTTALAAAMDGARPARRVRRARPAHRAAAPDGRGDAAPPTCALVQADLLAPLPFAPPFDCVLVDAPCSGLGTLRRDPDIRWRRRESRSRAAGRARSCAMLRPRGGGRRAGRPARLRDLLERAGGERSGRRRVPRGARRRSRRSTRGRRTRRCPARSSTRAAICGPQPHRHGLEAFFGAVFERRREPELVRR